jgi:hypothetical protein
MAKGWRQGATISSQSLEVNNPALATKLAQLIGSLVLCDSVQYWHDQKPDRTQPFFLFSWSQLTSLKKIWSSQKSLRPTSSKFVGVTQVEVEKKFVWLPETTSALQRKLVERLVNSVPELRGCTGFVFERTRAKAPDLPKWIVDFKIDRSVVRVGSLTPARELVRGTSKRIVVTEDVDGVILVGFGNQDFDRVVGRLVELGLYSDEVASALGRAMVGKMVPS